MSGQVALTSWRTPGDDVSSSLRFAADVGAEGLQVDLGGVRRGERLDAPGHAARVRDEAQDQGIALIALGVNAMNDVGLTAAPDTLAARRVRGLLARQRDTALSLGVPMVFVPSFRRSAITDDETLARTAEVLTEAADHAAREGLLLASENGLGPAGSLRLVRAVSRPAFRVLFDTGNPPDLGIDPVELACALGACFADQVHVKDPAGPSTAAVDEEQERAVAAAARCIPHVRWWVGENDLRRGHRAQGVAEIARLRRIAGVDATPSRPRVHAS